MTKDWPRLATAVAKRRRELGLSRDAVRQRGGPSDLSIQRIEENAEPHPRDDTINKLDAPLRWEDGSAQRVLAGGDPIELGRPVALAAVSTDELLAELRKRIPADESEPVIAEFIGVDAPGVNGADHRKQRKQL